MGRRFLGAAPAAILLIALASSYLPFISDDALISLRYAQRLLDGHGLTWTAGEAVEGYSNLLWVLLAAALGALGLDLIDAVRILGFVGSLGALVALQFTTDGAELSDLLPSVVSAMALALTGALAVWTVGGLEQPLVACLLAWAVATALPLLEDPLDPRDAWRPGLFLALLCWTRPDAPLFAATFAAGLWLARGGAPSGTILRVTRNLLALPVAAYLVQLGGRLVYYGEWVPNSALAKVAFTSTRLTEGLAYVGQGLLWTLPLGFAAVVLALLPSGDARHVRRVRFLAVPLVAWTTYVAVIGGDSFPAYRHLLSTLVLMAFLLAEGLRARLLQPAASPMRRGVTVAGGLLGLLALGLAQLGDPQNQRARDERWEWDGEVSGLLLRQAFPPETLIAVDAAGTLPYFSGLPAVDMLGINDRYLAANPPADFGTGDLGHELGDGNYVLSREPDLIVFCSPTGGARPCFRSGQEMVELPGFGQRYRLVTLAAETPRPLTFQPWVRAEGGPLGIRRSADRVEVPAYLLMATGRTAARLEAPGELIVDVSPSAPAGVAALGLPPGNWQLRVEPPGPVRLSVGQSRTGRRLGSGSGPLTFALPAEGPAEVDVLLEAGSGPIIINALIAERVPSTP